jgi:hypothetical protein
MMVSRLLSLGLVLFCALVSPAQAADGDRTPVRSDLGETILNAPPLEARDILGQASALVSAAQGRAFVLEVAQGRRRRARSLPRPPRTRRSA